jgi:hypothetical protein
MLSFPLSFLVINLETTIIVQMNLTVNISGKENSRKFHGKKLSLDKLSKNSTWFIPVVFIAIVQRSKIYKPQK